MRRAFRVDRNQSSIAKGLRALGCSVYITAAHGGGFPDMLVSCPRGKLFLFEVKDGDKPPSARKLTEDEVQFRNHWKSPIYTILRLSDALTIMRLL